MTVPLPDYQTPERMAIKREAIPLPECSGTRVLDIGCDHGYWSFLAAGQGAGEVVGIDRNRLVKGRGFVDLIAENRAHAAQHPQGSVCTFRQVELGRQWPALGAFDIVLMFSVYHHVFECAGGDHLPIWFWLWRQCAPGGVVFWENPVDTSDSVVQRNVSAVHHARYNKANILNAADRYFEAEYIGPALHVPTREVWCFRRREIAPKAYLTRSQAGADGATAAFEYAEGRRIAEIEHAIGVMPFPGSLNLIVQPAFDWDRGYYRAEVLDVTQRGRGLDTEWAPRWARFYPVRIASRDAFAFRFEGEKYPANFVELIAAERLRDHVGGVASLWR